MQVNLKSGKTYGDQTCTAGAGTLLLEFGTLSRLTNHSIFELKAKRALQALWARRTSTNLVGDAINVNTGRWEGTMSGTGAGLDSFYEYLLKAYILFGENDYWNMFADAYTAVNDGLGKNRHVFVNQDMHSGKISNTWVDSLSAFFPGLQVGAYFIVPQMS